MNWHDPERRLLDGLPGRKMMNTTMMMPSAVQEDTLSFLAFPAKKAASQVNGTTEHIFQNIGTILNQITTDALSARNALQFEARRSASFPKYIEVMLGLSRLINATVSSQVIDRLTGESLSKIEFDLRESGVLTFGEYLTNQALFTVFSLRKINDLANRIAACDELEHHLIPSDRELHHKFVWHVLYGRFHIDCLTHSLRSSTPMFPEVGDCVSNGLRPVVNAYAYIKQALDMRSKEDEEALIHIGFDDEEKELLNDSTCSPTLEA